MKFLVFTSCLFLILASVYSLSINQEDENEKVLSFVKSSLKQAQNELATLESQLKQQYDYSTLPRSESSELLNVRSDMVSLYSQLNKMRSLTRHLERSLKRTRRSADEKREGVVAETTSTVVNSAAVGIQSTLATLNTLMININKGINSLFTRLSNQITNVAVSANNAAQTGVATLNNVAQSGINNVNNAANAVAGTVYNGVQTASQNVGSAIQSGYNAVSSAASNGMNAAANTVQRLTG